MNAVDRKVTPVAVHVAEHGRPVELTRDEIEMTIECPPPESV